MLIAAVALLASVLTYVEATGPTTTAFLGATCAWTPPLRLFPGFINPIFFAIAVYVWSRLSTTPSLQDRMGRFVFCSLLFFSASNVVLIANHFFVLWIALEVSTLAAAPLIVRAETRASRLASFRYVLFSSVGLALVLLGFVCLSRSMEAAGQPPTFFLDRLRVVAGATSNDWGGALGLALIILGLGTKLGLAPMYSWLPEVYDHAPPAVTALLGAVQFNAALVFLLRVVQVFRPTHPGLVASVLLAMGLVSMVVSTFSIIATRNMVRLIAYASINHAGVIAIRLGVGKSASYGLLLYVISNAFIKAILFLTAGTIEARYGTKDTSRHRRLAQGAALQRQYSSWSAPSPCSASHRLAAFFGELLILSALVGSGHLFVFAAFCLLITMTFVATGRTVFPMIWGESKQRHIGQRQTLISATPKLFFLLVLLVLGIYIPRSSTRHIQQVAFRWRARDHFASGTPGPSGSATAPGCLRLAPRRPRSIEGGRPAAHALWSTRQRSSLDHFRVQGSNGRHGRHAHIDYRRGGLPRADVEFSRASRLRTRGSRADRRSRRRPSLAQADPL